MWSPLKTRNGNVVPLLYPGGVRNATEEKVEKLKDSQDVYHSKVCGLQQRRPDRSRLVDLRGFVPALSGGVLCADLGQLAKHQSNAWVQMVGRIGLCAGDRSGPRASPAYPFGSARLCRRPRETLKERLLDHLAEGDVRTGRVTSLAEVGAL